MNQEMDAIVGTLIAGPARCGKTSLAATLVEDNSSQAVLTVDALFPVFRSKKPLRTMEERVRFLGDYLRRPRYMDPARRTVRSPADDIGDCLDSVVEEAVKTNASAPLSLIGAALNTWAKRIGENTWIAPDLHAEIYFKQLIRLVPNLHMIVLLRDPREAIAASLYWRTFPNRMVGGWRVVLHKLFLWCLSADVGSQLSKSMPERVRVIFTNSLRSTFPELTVENFPEFVLPSQWMNGGAPQYFSYQKEHGWLGPDGKWHQLLSDGEKCVIEQVSQPWFAYPQDSKDLGSRKHIASFLVTSILTIILSIARVNPGFAKWIIEFSLFPLSRSRAIFWNFSKNLLDKFKKGSSSNPSPA